MASTDDLTVVLAIKDRAPFTARWMTYADRIAFPFPVVIADGGRDPAIERILGEPGRFPRLRYRYIRYPYDETYTDYYAKMADVVSRVETPLVALADDDDFWVMDGLRRALAFMREHPQYVACGGQIADFWVNVPDRRDVDNSLYGGPIEWRCRYVSQPPVNTSARERLAHYTSGHYEPFYFVHRTPVLRDSFVGVRDARLGDYYLSELLRFLLVVIAGDTRVLDTLYLARQANSPGSSMAAHEARFGDSLGRMLVPSWSEDFTAAVEVAADALARADGIPVAEARSCIVRSYRMWAAADLVACSVTDLAASASGTEVAATVLRSLYNIPRAGRVRQRLQAWYRGARRSGTALMRRVGARPRGLTDADHALEAIREFVSRADTRTDAPPRGEQA